MKKNINLEIGERVRRVRTQIGLSREQLSEMLDISTLFLGYIECGQRGMSLATLRKMCSVLNVSADYILSGKEESETIRKKIEVSISDIEDEYLPLALENINGFKKMLALVRKKADEQ